MTRVLFVDDEPIVLRSLDRAFRAQRRPWQVSFAASGEAALAMLDREAFDVIVSDISMPKMDGITLLQSVRERFPHITRLALSGEASSSDRQRAVLVIHQWLSKPCPLAKLCGTIEHVSWSRTLIDDPELVATVCQLGSLPTAPQLYLRVTVALSRNAPLGEVVSMIETDPAVAAKLLQLVNSAFFAQAERVTSVKRAASIIGTDLLCDLLLAAEVFRGGSSAEKRAQHAQLVANLARAFAPAEVADDAYVAGLLHDLGELALADLPPPAAGAHAPFLHARLAGLLLGTWGMPVEVVAAATFHHDPEAAPRPEQPTLRAVALAEALACELEEPGAPSTVPALAAAMGLDPEACRARALEVQTREPA